MKFPPLGQMADGFPPPVLAARKLEIYKNGNLRQPRPGFADYQRSLAV